MPIRAHAFAAALAVAAAATLALGGPSPARADEAPTASSPPAAAVTAVPAPASSAPAPSAPAPPADPAEEALRRVLRSGCRDGLPELQAQAGHPGASWAPTVARLCGEILRQAPVAPPAPPPSVAHDGRGLAVVGFTLYGIWLGIATDVLFTIDGPRSAIVPPLLGMAAGLALSLQATGDYPLSNSQSWTIVTGLEYGSINGALWAGSLDLNAQGVVGAALATGLAAGAVGVLVASEKHPRAGDIEVVRSGLLWGTAAGLLTVATFFPDATDQNILRAAGASMDLGLVGGLALATSFDLSRNRVLIIDAGTLGGGLAGAGLTWLISGGPGSSGRAIAAGGLGGMLIGTVAGALLSRNMDRGGDLAAADAAVPALVTRDRRGRWGLGSPAPAPVLDRFGTRVVGATLTAVGGTF